MAEPDLLPAELLRSVVAHFRPRRVILFGSAARGVAGPDSDIDLLVVLDDDAPPALLGARSVYEARKDYYGAVDILPCRQSALDARARAKGSFADIVLREGITVYERQ
ncbi:MAG TPA: nucleotidyltransferase domain-containing protein [Stellaceae bacterium]|jgi:predicted nucleotidyltransferase|nr:nucleotidyltransferase domain-containing protein [Stellaceae bacterium]